MSLNLTEIADIFEAQNQSCLSLEAFYPYFNVSQIQGRINSIATAPELELVHVLSRKSFTNLSDIQPNIIQIITGLAR